ncbi:MAG TPA: hypothetical protein GXZ47_04880, partial [Treponema sp.]|nr:hypothetical protein [Treponema sp.]
LKFETTPKINTNKAGTIAVTLGSLFTQTGVSPHSSITETGWQQLWTDTLTYAFSLGEPDAAERTGKTSFKTDWNTPFSQNSFAALNAIRFTTEAESCYRSAATVSRTSRGDASLAFPIRIGKSVLTPSWIRSIGGERPVTVGGEYWSDTQELFSDLSNMDYMFTIAPIYDLFASNMKEKIRDTNTHSSRLFLNRYSLSWFRMTSSGLKDLWIPLKIETAISRKTETSAAADTAQDIWNTSIQAGFTALNIAGTYGIVPIFNWFEQDEFSQLYRWSSSWGTGFFTWNMDTWHSILLFFSNGATVSLENAFHYDSPSISGANELTRDTLAFIWKRPGPDSFVVGLIRRITELPLTTRREDSLRFIITKSKEITIGINWNHTLTTGIGTNGEVSLTGGTGFSRNQDGSAVLELLLGIGGKLSY